jgi:hypothetical protein
LEAAITNPGAVKINVTGAFIVDDEPRSKSPVDAEGVHYENKDIRLPHHTGVVSHVAVDVSYSDFSPRTVFTPQSRAIPSHKKKAWLTGYVDLDRLAEHLRSLFISLESRTLRITAVGLIFSTLKPTGSIYASTSFDNSKRNTRSAMVQRERDFAW